MYQYSASLTLTMTCHTAKEILDMLPLPDHGQSGYGCGVVEIMKRKGEKTGVRRERFRVLLWILVGNFASEEINAVTKLTGGLQKLMKVEYFT